MDVSFFAILMGQNGYKIRTSFEVLWCCTIYVVLVNQKS